MAFLAAPPFIPTTRPPRASLRRRAQRPIILFDTETTGLSPSKNHLVEIALMEYAPKRVKSPLCFSSLIHPPVETPRAASRVHGITNEMIRDAPGFAEVWAGVLEYVNHISYNRGRPLLVAHNVSFDLSFMKEELKRNGLELPDWDFACSLRDVSNVIWGNGGNSLKGLGERLGVVNEEQHRAMSDVKALGEILGKTEEVLREKKEGGNLRMMLENGARKRRGEEDRMEVEHGGRGVYVTRTGILWHERRECELLDLARVIWRVDGAPEGKLGCYKCVQAKGKGGKAVAGSSRRNR